MECCAIGVRPRAADKLQYVFLIFLAGSVAGWIHEEVFCWMTEGVLQNRGILYGPWLPIYGIGALGIAALKPLKKHPALLFVLCMAVAGVVEYVIGYAGIHLFGLRLWDYRDMPMNIDGIVCLGSVACFGILGLAFHYLLEPAGEKLLAKVDGGVLPPVCLGLLALFVTDCIFSFLFRTPITY